MGPRAGSTSGWFEDMSKGKNLITHTQRTIGHIFAVKWSNDSTPLFLLLQGIQYTDYNKNSVENM